jgi:hypothetical protein
VWSAAPRVSVTSLRVQNRVLCQCPVLYDSLGRGWAPPEAAPSNTSHGPEGGQRCNSMAGRRWPGAHRARSGAPWPGRSLPRERGSSLRAEPHPRWRHGSPDPGQRRERRDRTGRPSGPSRRPLAGGDMCAGKAEIHASCGPLSNDDVQGTMLSDLNVDELVQPFDKALRSRLGTTSAVAGHVRAPRCGVVFTDARPRHPPARRSRPRR